MLRPIVLLAAPRRNARRRRACRNGRCVARDMTLMPSAWPACSSRPPPSRTTAARSRPRFGSRISSTLRPNTHHSDPREIARLCATRFHRLVSHHTVQGVLAKRAAGEPRPTLLPGLPRDCRPGRYVAPRGRAPLPRRLERQEHRRLPGDDAAGVLRRAADAPSTRPTRSAQYTVASAPDGRHIRAVKDPRLFATRYPAPQPFLPALARMGRQPALRLPAYVARRPRPLASSQAPLFVLDGEPAAHDA